MLLFIKDSLRPNAFNEFEKELKIINPEKQPLYV